MRIYLVRNVDRYQGPGDILACFTEQAIALSYAENLANTALKWQKMPPNFWDQSADPFEERMHAEYERDHHGNIARVGGFINDHVNEGYAVETWEVLTSEPPK